MITRKLQAEVVDCAREYPAVTILGPRQSGKTTLAKMSFPDKPYYSLEAPDIRRQALDDPRGFLRECPDGAILDEIQRAAELVSYLQGEIDADRRPGRFVLTGSHQPLVHQAISQSLAGRTCVLELLPFAVEEARRYPEHPRTPFEWIASGFYPALHKDKLRPSRFFRSYLATYVERDIREMINIKDVSRFEAFLRLLAGQVGQLVNYTSLASDVGVSSTTIKSWVSILKASYVLFELPPFYANIRKRLVKSPKLYFTDVGLAAWLLGLETAEQVARDPLRGPLFENLIVMEVVKILQNDGKRPNLHFYRDANGNEVDLLIGERRSFAAIEIKSAATFQPEFTKGLAAFRDSVAKDATIDNIVWYNGDRKVRYEDTVVSNPLEHGFRW
jgi:predicted AAA+ superfamily ATPase